MQWFKNSIAAQRRKDSFKTVLPFCLYLPWGNMFSIWGHSNLKQPCCIGLRRSTEVSISEHTVANPTVVNWESPL